MPARQPFTTLCQSLARPRSHGRVDLHVHTTSSDGVYRPAQIVELARRFGTADSPAFVNGVLDRLRRDAAPAPVPASPPAEQGPEPVTPDAVE